MKNLIEALSDHFGIIPSYYDIWGNLHSASIDQKIAVLNAMGIEAHNEHSTRKAVSKVLDDLYSHPIPPVISLDMGTPITIPCILIDDVHCPSTINVEWNLILENGESHSGQFNYALSKPVEKKSFPDCRWGSGIQEKILSTYLIDFPLYPPEGYHQLNLRIPTLGVTTSLFVIVAPPQAFTEISRSWGLAVQLYAARSLDSVGMGDFGDLLKLIHWASELGASFIGLNPFHYGYPENPHHISPYSASSRRFLNPLYVAFSMPFFGSADEEVLHEIREQSHGPLHYPQNTLIDYETVIPTKWKALKKLYHHFQTQHIPNNTPHYREFLEFVHKKGSILNYFSLFEVLRWHFGMPWWNWPQSYQYPDRLSESDIPNECLQDTELIRYLQFLAHTHLNYCKTTGHSKTSPVLLYLDLAVGVDRGGFDVWYDRECYAYGADIGAPPDDFNPNGQNWGVAPFIPNYLRKCAYKPFIEIIRENMVYASILRIDHVMGLFRLFWIPDGFSPKEGVYVRYPLEDLARIVNLESVRNRCVVVGEDLGTVPDRIREEITRNKWFSCKVLYFSKKPDGSYMSPEEYQEHSIASVSTHDLPTLIGFWKAKDLELRAQLGMFASEETALMYRKQRERDKTLLLDVLLPNRGISPEIVSPAELTEAALTFLARSRSRMMAIQMEDLLLEENQANLPGTVSEYPSWKISWKKYLEDIMADEFIRTLAARVTSLRHSPASDVPQPQSE